MIAAAVIAASVIATIALAATMLAPHLAPTRVVFDTRPDRPRPFGVRMAWIAIRTRDTARVIATLGLTNLRYANWNTGLGAVYSPDLADSHIFVSPPVDGWTFVVGAALPTPLGAAFADKTTPVLLALGTQFADVQYFVSYPALETFGWARVLTGRLVRAFAASDGGATWAVGKVTKEEKALGLRLFAPRTSRVRMEAGRPLEARAELGEPHVLRLAALWGLDPMRPDTRAGEPGIGYVATPPTLWRAERALKQAA